VMCPAVASAPVLLFDSVDGSGTGQRAWLTSYGGGTMWLSGAGAWANGDPSYTATLSQFSPSMSIPVEVLRDGKTITLQVTLGTRPANP